MIDSVHSVSGGLGASTWNWLKAGLAASIAVAALGAIATQALARTVEAGPDLLKDTTSLADLIERNATVHIVYVHGIREDGPGFAQPLAQMLAARLGFERLPTSPDTKIAMPPKPNATILGTTVWSDEEWQGSQPFVRHYHLRKGKHEIKIDEVNYWPLLFLLKCRYLMVPEHDLAGDDKAHLELCGRSDGPYHSVLRDEDRKLLAAKPRGGHAALINRALKLQIMNWGLSDAVIALGPMRVYLNYAMDRAFDAARKTAGENDKFVIMSESLGSFVVLDAMDLSPAVKDVFQRTDDLYFLANQVALLELARIEGIPTTLATPSEPAEADLIAPAPASAADGPLSPAPARRRGPIAALQAWASSSANLRNQPKQIIAFSDPSDILTYPVPAIPHVKVVNIYDRNTPRWLGLFADPGKAHLGHLRNREVWKVLLRRGAPDPSPQATR